VLRQLGGEVFDILVIGGGVTGCGAALDAAARGLSVALVERRDFAAGTSSRSSKLIHGGLRYLERFELGLVRECLRERRLLIERIAPHLVHPAAFLLPLKHGVRDRFYMGAGLALYDTLGGVSPAVPRHRHLSRNACRRVAPSLRNDDFAGGIRYFDAQVDDARFAVTLATTAESCGAVCASAVEVAAFLHAGARVTGVRARDLEGGAEFDISARVVVNATGVWTGEMERLAGVDEPLQIRPSKGVHIVVPRSRIDMDLALILPTEKSVLFVLPWGDQWIIGTTDTDWQYGLDHPSASRADVDYLLGHANAVLREPLTLEDITAVYAGLRPLIGGGPGDTAALSRDHTVRRGAPGIVSVVGGKYTTYRVMAQDAVDAAARELPFAVAPSRTVDVPLLGAVGWDGAAARARLHAGGPRVSPQQIRHLVARYGSLALDVLDLVAQEPALATPLTGADTYLAAEVRHAVLREGALHVDDVLTRRTHIAFEAPDRGRQAVEDVARLMAPLLAWDAAVVDREIAHYRARLDAEQAAQAALDDASSASARAPVRDVRLEGGGGGPAA
jgi:glycerol-3-phosphate dehydrogenase